MEQAVLLVQWYSVKYSNGSECHLGGKVLKEWPSTLGASQWMMKHICIQEERAYNVPIESRALVYQSGSPKCSPSCSPKWFTNENGSPSCSPKWFTNENGSPMKMVHSCNFQFLIMDYTTLALGPSIICVAQAHCYYLDIFGNLSLNVLA